MKLVVGVLPDFKAVGGLARQLMAQGCLADQLTFLADHAPGADVSALQRPSLYLLLQKDALMIWAIREPEYYNRGIRDHRVLSRETIGRIERFDRYHASSPQLSTDRYLLRHKPLALLHLQNRSSAALEQVKWLVRYSQDRVQMIDMPNW